MNIMSFVKIHYFYLLLLVMNPAYADEPPPWQTRFSVMSENKKFIAYVSPVSVDNKSGHVQPWDMLYKLEMKSVQANKLLWSVKYDHSGYSDILVSDDGRYAVYVSFWFYSSGPVVKVYDSGGVNDWDANKLGIPQHGLPRTASHRLWLEGDVKFIENESGKTTGLAINTLKGLREIEFEE